MSTYIPQQFVRLLDHMEGTGQSAQARKVANAIGRVMRGALDVGGVMERQLVGAAGQNGWVNEVAYKVASAKAVQEKGPVEVCYQARASNRTHAYTEPRGSHPAGVDKTPRSTDRRRRGQLGNFLHSAFDPGGSTLHAGGTQGVVNPGNSDGGGDVLRIIMPCRFFGKQVGHPTG